MAGKRLSRYGFFWTATLLLALVAGGACHLLARRQLVDIELAYTLGGEGFQTQYRYEYDDGDLKEVLSFESIPPLILQNMRSPWPLPAEPADEPVDLSDPNLSAETIMGLALAGPPEWGRQMESAEDLEDPVRAYARWLRRVSDEALRRTESVEQKRRFQLLVVQQQICIQGILNTANFLSPDADEDSAPPEQPSLESLYRQAAGLDPSNAMWLYAQAAQRLESRIEYDPPENSWDTASGDGNAATASTRPAEEEQGRDALDYRFIGGADLESSAEMVRPLLERAEVLPIRSSESYLDLYEQAAQVRGSVHMTRWSFGQGMTTYTDLRSLARRLCFMGDLYLRRGDHAAALRMYRHAYQIGRKLIEDDPTESDALVGMAIDALATAHLHDYWNQQSATQRAAQLARREQVSEAILTQFSSWYGSRGPDPAGFADREFVAWLRRTGLAWWLSVTGLLALAHSAWLGVLHLLGRRWRWLTNSASCGDAGPYAPQLVRVLGWGLAACGIAVLTAVVCCWAVPTTPLHPSGLAAMVVWLALLALLGPAWLTWLAGRLTLGHGRKLTGGALAVATAAGIIGAGFALPYPKVGLIWSLLVAGVLLLVLFGWAVWVAVGWVRRRDRNTLVERAKCTRVSGVLSGLATLVFLSAAVVGLLAASNAQEQYFQAVGEARPHWQRYVLTAPLVQQLPPLQPAIFQSGIPSSHPGQAAGGVQTATPCWIRPFTTAAIFVRSASYGGSPRPSPEPQRQRRQYARTTSEPVDFRAGHVGPARPGAG